MQNTEKRLKSKTGDPSAWGQPLLYPSIPLPVPPAPPFAPAAGISSTLLGDIRHQQHTQELQRISSTLLGDWLHQASAAHVAAAAEADAPSCCCALLAATATLKLLRLFENGDNRKVYCGRAAARTDGTWCRRLPLQLAVAGMGAMLQGLASPVLTSAAHTGMPVSPPLSTIMAYDASHGTRHVKLNSTRHKHSRSRSAAAHACHTLKPNFIYMYAPRLLVGACERFYDNIHTRDCHK